jgi:hypothetical protein
MAVEIIEALVELKEIIRAAAAFVEITDSTLETKERVDRLQKARSEKSDQNHIEDPQKLLKKAGSLLLTFGASAAIALVSVREVAEIVAKSPLVEIAGAVPVVGTAVLMGAYTINAGMAAWKISALRREEMDIKVKDKDGNYKKDANGDFICQKAKPTLYQLFIKNSDLKFNNPKEEAEHKERLRKLKVVALITTLLVVSVAFPPAGAAIGAAITGIVAANAAYTLYKNRDYFIDKLKNISESIKDRFASSDDATAQKGILRRMGAFLIEKISPSVNTQENKSSAPALGNAVREKPAAAEIKTGSSLPVSARHGLIGAKTAATVATLVDENPSKVSLPKNR